MTTGTGTLLSGALAYAGFAALCLAMHRHARQVYPAASSLAGRALPLRVAGWGLLLVSSWPVLACMRWGEGLVTWLAVLTASVLPLALGLAYWPRVVALAGPLVVLAGAGLLAVLD